MNTTEPIPQNELRQGVYEAKGDYHKDIDPNWSYYPIYVNKLEALDELLAAYGAEKGSIIDAGCGEGVLVEKYAERGWDIRGFDMNYKSERVTQGSMMAMPYEDNACDTLLCLDVMEHLLYPDQEKALAEIRRVVKPGGLIIFSIPNLAHFTARLKFLLRGRLLRTAPIEHHPGDRPALEYQQLFESHGLKIEKKLGIFPTIPPVYRWVMHTPSRCAGLLRFLRKLPLPVFWHFQVLFVCRNAG